MKFLAGLTVAACLTFCPSARAQDIEYLFQGTITQNAPASAQYGTVALGDPYYFRLQVEALPPSNQNPGEAFYALGALATAEVGLGGIQALNLTGGQLIVRNDDDVANAGFGCEDGYQWFAEDDVVNYDQASVVLYTVAPFPDGCVDLVPSLDLAFDVNPFVFDQRFFRLRTLEGDELFGTVDSMSVSILGPNDTCATPLPLLVGGSTGTFPFDTTQGTTASPADSLCSCGPNGGSALREAWFGWVPTSSGLYTISTVGLAGGADTLIAVHDDCGFSLACSDDAGSPESEVRIRAVAGRSYRIRVATGSGSPAGTAGQFSITAGATLPAILETARWNDREYALIDLATWPDARIAAQEWGGDLAVIRSAEENAFLVTTWPARHLWLGLTDRREEGTFEWVDGSFPGFEDFLVGQPTNDAPGEDYVHVTEAEGAWNDRPGCRLHYAVAERPGAYQENCFGNGGDPLGCTACPCGNDAPGSTPLAQLGGCLNSSGSGAKLLAFGSADTVAGDLRFELRQAPSSTVSVLFSGASFAPLNPSHPCFGTAGGIQANWDGLRCVGGSTTRHGARSTDAAGEIGAQNAGWGPPDGPVGGLAIQGGFSAGQTRRFQAWMRDNMLAVCNYGINTSQAVSVTFFAGT